ncbi:MAG: CHAD domain-containing protein [Archangiaceae bacterium]|nr:CHAD domain-containing protein [Archangiaceae bacterium]
MEKSLDEVLDSPAPAGVRLVAAGFLDEWLSTVPRLHGDDDDEALHDYRVALRKLRSWLRTFDEGGNKIQKQLSTLNDKTGAARDLEVMHEWLEHDTSPAAQHALARLNTGADVEVPWVDARTQKVAERLNEKLSRYVLEVPLGAAAAVVPFSWTYAAAIRRLHNELNELALQAGSIEDPDLLHKVRIRAKRLRYALVPLKEWEEVADALRLLKEKQDLLGELHDRHAFSEALDRLLLERPPPELATGLDGLIHRARTEGHELFAKYLQHRHANDVRLAALLDVVCERLGRRLGLHLEVVPQG